MASISKIKMPNNIIYNIKDSSVYGLGTEITANSNFNDYKIPGTYYTPSASISITILNRPADLEQSVLRLEVYYTNSATRFMQKLYSINITNGNTVVYIRQYTASGWQSWHKFEGIVIS